MSAYPSSTLFAACEERVRRFFLPCYHRYRGLIDRYGAAIHDPPHLSALEISLLIASVASVMVLPMTMQAEFFQNRNLLEPIIPSNWMATNLSFLAAGLLGSFALAQQFPGLAFFKPTSAAASQSKIDQLVVETNGIIHTQRLSQFQIVRRAALAFLIVCFSVITLVAVQQAIAQDQLIFALIIPFFYILDVVAGLGLPFLLSFMITRYQRRRQRRQVNELETECSNVTTLYNKGRQKFFEEHPELKNDDNAVPPVSPLAAWVIMHPFHPNFRIPDHILKPDEPKAAGNAATETAARRGETTKDEPLDHPEDLHSTLNHDHHSDDDIDDEVVFSN